MRTITNVILTAVFCFAVATPTGSQTLLDKLLAKATRSKGAAASAGTGANGGTFAATITPAQQAEVDRLLAAPLQDQRIAADRAEATSLIVKLLGIGACARVSDAWNAINRDSLRPQTYHAPFSSELVAMDGLTYHDKNRCLDVARVTDWSKPALNALQFRAYYIAADSGEAKRQLFELQKTSDGVWMVKTLGSALS